MAAYLELMIDGKQTRIPCGSVETIGRDKSNTIAIKDALSSRNHAVIRRVGNDQYYLLDAGSRNGSYINNQRITAPTMMHDGDKVSIGETVIVFAQEPSEDDGSKTIDGDETDLGETISFVRSDIRSVTILVADIRDYSGLSERIDIKVLSKLMSKWFYEVQNIIQRHGGRVDKFIGDCVMAVWDTHNSADTMIEQCLRAAGRLHRLTRELGERNPDINEEMRIGVGVNTGIAALGIGQENTVMGDTVNLAFRLETATKDLNRDIVLSQSSYNHLPQDVWDGREEEVSVKGKRKPVSVIGLSLEELEQVLDEHFNDDAADHATLTGEEDQPNKEPGESATDVSDANHQA